MDRLKVTKPTITPLKIIDQIEGRVMHALKESEDSFINFGEAYFSSVHYGMTKGWKLHKKMTLNLIVPHGEIRFLVHHGNEESDVIPLVDEVLGENNYSRLTIPPNNWVAFQGIGMGKNMLLNIANIEHDPSESINKSLSCFNVRGFEYNE